MDFSTLSVNGVLLLALVFGLTQFIKEAFNLNGNAVRFVSFFIAVLLMVAYQLMPLIAEPYDQIVSIVVTSLAFAMAAGGYYQYLNRKNEPA